MVIVPEAGIQAYIGGAILSGAEPWIVPLRPENDFLVELDQLPADVLERARVVYVNYPNNPTAAIAPHDYLVRLVAACRKYGIVLAYDNAPVRQRITRLAPASIFEIAGARDISRGILFDVEVIPDDGWRRRVRDRIGW